MGHALGVEAEQLVRHLLDLLLDALLRLVEGLPTQPIDLRLVALAARVLLELMQARDGEEELVAVGVLDDEHLHVGGLHAAQLLVLAQPERLALEPEVAAHAVIGVHDVVAHLELAQVLEERAPFALVAAPLVLAALAAMGPRAEDLLLGDQRQGLGGQHEARREAADRHLNGAAGPRRQERGREARRLAAHLHAVTLQQRGQPLRLGRRPGREHDAQARIEPALGGGRERRQGVVLAVRPPPGLDLGHQRRLVFRGQDEHLVVPDVLELGQRAGLGIALAAHRQPVHHRHRSRAEPLPQRVLAHVVVVEREGRLPLLDARAVIAQRAIERLGGRLHGGDGIEHHHQEVVRQVVEERLERRVEGREVVLQPEVEAPALEVLDELPRGACGQIDGVAQLADAQARQGDLVGPLQGIADGVDVQLGQALERALIVRIEALDGEHQPVVELDAGRVLGVWRIDVDDAAPNREGAGVLDHRHAHVAALDQRAHQRVAIDLVLRAHHRGALQDGVAGQDAAPEGGQGRDQEAPRQPLGQVEQRREPVHGGSAVRRHLEERADLVRRIQQHLAGRLAVGVGEPGEQLEVRHGAAGRVAVAGEHQELLPGALGHAGHQERGGARRQPAQIDAAPALESAQGVVEPSRRAREGALDGARGGGVGHGKARCRPRGSVAQLPRPSPATAMLATGVARPAPGRS